MTRPTARTWAGAGLFVTAVTAALLLADVSSPIRLVAAVLFVVFVPGYSVVGLLKLHDPATEITVSAGFGLTLGILVAQVLVWMDAYSVGRTFAILATVSTVGLLAQLRATGSDAASC